MEIMINKAHFPVTVLGPGKRIGLWFQGCSKACPGCISYDTWHKNDSFRMSVEILLDWCKKTSVNKLDGVTISGGEPFEQPEALASLLDGLDAWRTSMDRPFDILCYSGFTYSELKKKYNSILDRIDAIIPEPYIKGQRTDKQWCGSNNQPLILLSDLAKERVYFNDVSSNNRHIQFVVDNSKIWFIGVPRENDMERLRIRLRQKGINMEECSWKT